MKMNTTTKRRRDAKRIMPRLPDDIVDDILLMLPTKSICKFRCVCKHWHCLFKDSGFMETRLTNSIESEKINCFSIEGYNDMHITKPLPLIESYQCEYVKIDSPLGKCSREIDIVGSFNGLILMRSYDDHYDHHYDKSHWLWNPSKKELEEVFIPQVKYGPAYFQKINRSAICNVTYGVAYNCNPDYYTIVVATYYCSHLRGVCHGCEIQVYTSESNSWEVLPNLFPYEIISMGGMAQVIFVCGSFHWLARRLGSCNTDIVSLGENLNEVAVTPQVDELLNDRFYRALGVLAGCLCIVVRALCSQTFEVWVKKDYSVTESWTKLFIAELPVFGNRVGYMKLLWEFKNGEFLFVATKGSYGRNCWLVLYDSVSQKCKFNEIQHNANYGWNIEAYGERSQASFNSITGKKRPSCTQQGSRKSVRLAKNAHAVD